MTIIRTSQKARVPAYWYSMSEWIYLGYTSKTIQAKTGSRLILEPIWRMEQKKFKALKSIKWKYHYVSIAVLIGEENITWGEFIWTLIEAFLGVFGFFSWNWPLAGDSPRIWRLLKADGISSTSPPLVNLNMELLECELASWICRMNTVMNSWLLL